MMETLEVWWHLGISHRENWKRRYSQIEQVIVLQGLEFWFCPPSFLSVMSWGDRGYYIQIRPDQKSQWADSWMRQWVHGWNNRCSCYYPWEFPLLAAWEEGWYICLNNSSTGIIPCWNEFCFLRIWSYGYFGGSSTMLCHWLIVCNDQQSVTKFKPQFC